MKFENIKVGDIFFRTIQLKDRKKVKTLMYLGGKKVWWLEGNGVHPENIFSFELYEKL